MCLKLNSEETLTNTQRTVECDRRTDRSAFCLSDTALYIASTVKIMDTNKMRTTATETKRMHRSQSVKSAEANYLHSHIDM